jgi:hypothetical protein
MMKPPKHQLKPCSYYREGGRSPVSPPGRQGSSEIHLHQPWRQELGKETLDEFERRKMVRQKSQILD